MKKLITHSKSSLFLIEMILSILILALTCTICVRIFAAAKTQREEARELNHIQELVTSAGETLEGWNGQLSSFISIFGQPSKTSGALLQYYYDDSWNPCTENSAEYTMTRYKFLQLAARQFISAFCHLPFYIRKDGQP